MVRILMVAALLLIAAVVGGCQPAASTTSSGGAQVVPTSTDNAAKVKVMADGRVFLNGVEATIEQVKTEFQRLGSVGGSVCYSRENAAAEPHANAEAVLNAVIEANLPITLSETDCV